MNLNFDVLVNQILENNLAGSGGVFGAPSEPVYNPPNSISSGDTYARGDSRIPKVLGKGKKSKIIRRTFPELTTASTGKKKKNGKRK
jgi:hypothetical protein